MKKSQTKLVLWYSLLVIGGGVCAWASLVQLAGWPDPIFGWRESPKTAAGVAVVAIIFLVIGCISLAKLEGEDE